MAESSTTRSDTATRAHAFEMAYGAHRGIVFRYLRARCNSQEEAEDLTATTFERALDAHMKGLDAAVDLGWQLKTARNAAIDASRRGRVRRAFLLRPSGPESSPSAETLFLRGEARARIYEAVATLPELQRDALALRYGAGLKVREIAPIVGKSEEATQKVLERGIARLREVIDERD